MTEIKRRGSYSMSFGSSFNTQEEPHTVLRKKNKRGNYNGNRVGKYRKLATGGLLTLIGPKLGGLRNL